MNHQHMLRAVGALAVAFILLACAGGAAPILDSVGNGADRPPSQGEEPGGAPQPSPGLANDFQQQVDRQLIIYTGSLSLEVTDLRPAIDQADQVVRSLGGHVASSRVSDSSESRAASVTYRIPAERWDEALAGLRAIGARVLNESTSSEDVTAQFVDLEARITNLRATETALQAIMDRATTIDDVLEVQRELTEVRSDIESLTAQRDLLSNRAALATLEVRFEVPLPASSRVSEGWDLGREVDNAVAALVRLGQGLVSLTVWLLVVVVPILLPVLIVGWIALRLRRRWLMTHPPVAGGPAGPAGHAGASPGS